MRALLTAAEVGQLARPCYADETILTALIAEAEREDIKARIGDGLYLALKEAETDADLTEDQRLLLAGGTWTDTDGGSHLLTGLRTALAYYVYARVVRDGNIQSTRFGARLKTDENSTGTEDAERQRQYRQAFASADKYIAECVAFINRNAMTGGCARKVRSNRTKFHVVGGQAPAVSRVREDCGGSYVPQDTYTKEETDALLAGKASVDALASEIRERGEADDALTEALAGKADVSALEPIEQTVSAQGAAISDLDGSVSQLSGRTSELENKLNYVEPYDSGLRMVDGKSEEMMDINVQEHAVSMSDDSSTITITMNGNTGTVSANAVEADAISLGSKDLSELLAGKQDTLIAGEGINIAADGKTISASGGGGISDAPSDGKTYGRNNGAWAEVQGGGAKPWQDLSSSVILDETKTNYPILPIKDYEEVIVQIERTIDQPSASGIVYVCKMNVEGANFGNIMLLTGGSAPSKFRSLHFIKIGTTVFCETMYCNAGGAGGVCNRSQLVPIESATHYGIVLNPGFLKGGETIKIYAR